MDIFENMKIYEVGIRTYGGAGRNSLVRVKKIMEVKKKPSIVGFRVGILWTFS